jgi:glycine oxidase
VDFIVVGGGLIGMLTARELRLAGCRVTVLERGDIGREASWAGGGILSPLYPWRYPDAVSALATWSQQAYPALCATLAADTGVDPEWLQSGLLMADAGARPEIAAWTRRQAVPLQWCDRDTVKTLEPLLVTAAADYLLLPAIAQVRNPRLIKALAASLDQLGVLVETGVEVGRVAVNAGRVTGVDTARGHRPAANVVIAGGAWSGALLAPAGVSLPVEPVRGQMLLLRGRPGILSHIILAGEHYLIPRRDGRVLVGSTLEYVGYDCTTTDEARDTLHRFALSQVPALADCPIEAHWAGLRPGSPDSVPFIGTAGETAGLFVNAGHFRNGVVTGPASARLLADIALQRRAVTDPAPYAIKPRKISI